MRKLLLIVLIVGAVLVFFLRKNEETKEIRVRVIPNSNEVADLEIKEEVKNIVICYLANAYSDDYETMKDNILTTISDLNLVLNQQFGNVDVSFGSHTLYNKAYNNTALKNIETDTLLVVINSGSGDNWWASVYPKYLAVSSTKTVEYESILVNIIKKLKENK